MKRAGAVVALVLAILGAVPGVARAQSLRTVTGRVTGTTGEPIVGASVSVVGTTARGISDQAGAYRIVNVPEGAQTLSATRIGYSPRQQRVTVPASGAVTADFSLQATALQLGGVVVTATGRSQETRELGSAVGVVNTADVQMAPITSASQLLQGKVSGVVVTQSSGTTGGGSRVRIRGNNSMSLSNAPLFIVDGVRVENQEQSIGFGVGGQAPSRLNDLNPNDIESIEVLKGPAAAALYGTAAANGVIQVTTKSGHAGKSEIRAFGETGRIDQVAKFPDNFFAEGTTVTRSNAGVLSQGTGRCDIIRRAIGANPLAGQTGCTGVTNTYSFNPLYNSGDAAFHTGDRKALGASVSGGSEGNTFYLSTDYDNEHGVQPINTLQRLRVQANTNGRLSDKMTVGANVSYLDSRGEFPQSDNALYGLVGMALTGSALPSAVAATQGYADDPALFYDYRVFQNYTRVTASSRGEYRPLNWLTINGNAGVDRYAREDRNRIPRVSAYSSFGPPYSRGFIQDFTYNIYDLTTNGSGTAIFNLRPDLVSTSSLGTQYIRENSHRIYAFGAGLTPGLETSLAGATSDYNAGEQNLINATLSAYFQQQFAWRDRLFLNAAVRGDKNTAFGQQVSWITYPSVSGSWILSNESFFPKFDALNNFRLRAAYGQSGLRPGPLDALQNFGSQVTTASRSDVSAIIFNTIGNPALKPERISETEFGFESQFLDSRLGLEVSYFNKNSRDALVQKPLPPSAGSSANRFENLGSVTNRGTEYRVSATPIRRTNVEWNATLSGSFIKNKLTSLGVDAQGRPIPPVVVTSVQRHVEGYPLGSYFHFPIISYSDADGNGLLSPNEVVVRTDTVVYLGNPFPKRETSFSSDITFGNFVKLSGLLDYKGGMQLLNQTRAWRESTRDNFNAAALYDATLPLDRQAAIVARSSYGSYAGYVEDADFLKLREISLTFTLPQRYLRNVGVAKGLSLTVAGRNLKTWTKYTGLDPELNYQGQANFTTADFTTVPPNRLFQFRLDANF